jgi:hypothetical protein
MEGLPTIFNQDIEDISLTAKFSGSYELLKYIIKKYGQHMYSGQILQFALQNNYTIACSTNWKRNGVQMRVWNALHKDLVILRLSGKVAEDEVMSLKDLKEEFNSRR